MDRSRYKMRVSVMASISGTRNMEIGMLLNVSLKRSKIVNYTNCFNNPEAKTADNWLRLFNFAWNQLI
jgi:hypothetical protein